MAWGAGAIGAREGSGGGDGAGEADSGAGFFSTWGGWSVVLCLPAVQGGMARNSSKVRTRGLQHFQPMVYLYLSFLLGKHITKFYE